MLTAERYLHFDNVDISARQIVCSCSLCGTDFSETPRPEEHVGALLLRIRCSFDAHDCGGIVNEQELKAWARSSDTRVK